MVQDWQAHGVPQLGVMIDLILASLDFTPSTKGTLVVLSETEFESTSHRFVPYRLLA